MTDQPHTPSTERIRQNYVDYQYLRYADNHMAPPGIMQRYAEFDRWLATVEAAAEQRGAKRAFRRTQEIIAGFDHTIDEARNRDDMINTGYLIQEIDTEIQDLMEDDDETH